MGAKGTAGQDPEQLSGGFIQKSNGTLQMRVKPDKMSKPDPIEVEDGVGKGRRTKLAAFGMNPTIINAGDPEYAAAVRAANKYRKKRMAELHQLHGHVSSGAGALLASASLALAASRYLYERYAQTPEKGGGDLECLKQASSLADKSRAAELAAWEMSAREGVLKRKTEMASQGMPWLELKDGGDKAKAGRKSNVQRLEADNLETQVHVEAGNE
jgi:hypothetical protein